MENQLAHAITQTEYDLSYDKAAKKLLANKQILAQIMKNCVNEYSACSVDEIAEKYIEGTPEVGTVGVHVDDTNRPKKTSDVIAGSNNEDSTLTEGTINYDVRFDAIAPASEGSAEQKDVIRLINILGIKHSGKTEVSITPDTVLSGEITILALGEYKALQKCFRI